jgi:tRNA dimethylallyltransferase
MNSIGDSAGDSLPVSLPVICGPTASGKSTLALRLAEQFGAAIISADSRQVYRGFDIGTAKPGTDERARVPHYGIVVAEPDERYTAADWAASVPGWIGEIQAQGRRPIVVGGTGFYLRALFEPLFEEPEIDPVVRASVREVLGSMSGEEIKRWCEVLDPPRASLGRAQRERAVEVALITGRRISELHLERPRPALLPAPPRYLLIDPGTSLAGAIASRTDAMLSNGWLDEVQSLGQRVSQDAKAWTATGYDTMRKVTTGELTLEQGRERVIVATRQYAKRQRTWFRHQLVGERVMQLDPRAPDAFERAAEWFNSEERDG